MAKTSASELTERDRLAALGEIVESSANAIIGKTLEGVVTSWNRGAETLYGYSEDEAVGRSIELIFPSDRFSEEWTILDAVGRGERIETFHTTRRRKDGCFIEVSLTVSPIRNHEGEIVGCSSTAHDVTEQRKAELLTRSLVEFAPDATVIVDRDGRIELANSQVSALFGYAAHEVIGQPVEMLIPERFRGTHGHNRESYLSEPSTRPMGAGISLFARRRDGSEFPVDISLAPIETPSGTLTAAAVRDVSDRKRLEVARDEFIANAAHELRTPIAAIVGFTETLADYRSAMSETQIEDSLAALKRQGERANVLVRNLLDLSRLDMGRVDLELVAVDVAASIAEAVDAAPPPPDRILTIEAAPNEIAIADQARFVQVIVNLLTNAYRYGGKNISVSTVATPGSVTVEVCDDGPGVPAALEGQLFEPFSRGPDAPEAGGSGLGLALSRRLATAFRGTLEYEPVEPSGACFSVTLVR